jgi:hypothetical protein
VRWRRVAGPYFGNAVSTLTHAGREAEVRIEGTDADGNLRPVAERTLTAPAPERMAAVPPKPRKPRAVRQP